MRIQKATARAAQIGRTRSCVRSAPFLHKREKIAHSYSLSKPSMMMLLQIAAVATLLCATSFETQAQSDSGAGLVFRLSVTQVYVS